MRGTLRIVRSVNGTTERGSRMELPSWVKEDIEVLANDFSGQIVIEVWEGGVTRRDIVNRRQAPKIAAETLPRENL